MSEHELTSLLVIVFCAALAPLLADIGKRFMIAVVVVELVLGIIIGPQVLDVAEMGPTISVLANFGLAFLFFLAGNELEIERVRGRPLRLATYGWALGFAIALACAGVLQETGVVRDTLYVGTALSATSMGALVPILGDADDLGTRFGAFVLAAATLGEVGPIVATSVLFTGGGRQGTAAILVVIFGLTALAAAFVGMKVRQDRVTRVMHDTMFRSGQFALRSAILLLVAMVYLATQFGLNIILGAFAAGIVCALIGGPEDQEKLYVKLEGIGFGFFVPIFFITTGIQFNLDAVLTPSGLIRLPLFLVLFLVVRGAPAFLLYRNDLKPYDRPPFALLSATTLPLVVAITELAVSQGKMSSATSSALVGAGLVSVLLFPPAALTQRLRIKKLDAPAEYEVPVL
jgi:Kef-type K+ transport system membrane component KefB